MTELNLISTSHSEGGSITTQSLVEVLDRVGPEVIFLEYRSLPPSFYQPGGEGCVEFVASSLYQDIHGIKLVAVDILPSDHVSRAEMDGLQQYASQANPAILQLECIHDENVYMYGFRYLNSEICQKLLSKIHDEMLRAIDIIGDPNLGTIYQSWLDVHHMRENAMLDNIYRYCAENRFLKGAFLVGAAHRNALAAKIGERESDLINWTFWGLK